MTHLPAALALLLALGACTTNICPVAGACVLNAPITITLPELEKPNLKDLLKPKS